VEKQDLIRYRTYADALIRLNNAASVLLQEGADPEAIKLILSGAAKLYAELERRMVQAFSEEGPRNIDPDFPDPARGGWTMPPVSPPGP
jgi:hypothetical protein